MDARLDIPTCSTDAVRALQDGLGVSSPIAQILARRGLDDPVTARRWLAADEAHPASAFAGIEDAVALILAHVRAGSRITIHGDYDVDGVTSTAILLRALHTWRATVDHLLPDRQADGYGLTLDTVEKLKARGTQLLITVDCAVTAVEEIAAAKAAGIDVVVTDHHTPRADGVLPDCPIVHPQVCGYPFTDLCAAAVAYKLAGAIHAAAGGDPARADVDLDLVALATVADCVPLHGENRRLVREGLRAIATTQKPGLRALLKVGRVDPSAMDATDIGFRLAPRLNAAGRVARPDAALELLLTSDEDRAEQIAQELDGYNADRRHTEERIRFDAERQIAELGERPAYVLWGEDWHSGVIGIVASRIAERHRRPVLMVAVNRDGEGTGSGRSIPAFDLLGGLNACAEHLLRHGGHRAAAGCTVAADALPALRAAFEDHADRVLSPEDLLPVARVDAIVSGDELGLELAEELALLAPFGEGNPEPALLLPACRMLDVRPMGEGRHLRFAVHAGGVSARAVAFGTTDLPDGHETAIDATFALSINRWNGAVEPQLRLRHATPPAPAGILVLDEPAGDWVAAVLRSADLEPAPYAGDPDGGDRTVVDRRGAGALGVLASLVASGEPVLVACADSAARRRHLDGRVGGFALVSHEALLDEPELADPYRHLVLLDPPPHPSLLPAFTVGTADQRVHHLFGDGETRFAATVHEHLHTLRAPLAEVYRALRAGRTLTEALGGDGERPRHAVLAGRLLAVLEQTGLAEVDRDAFTATLPETGRVELDRSAVHRACEARLAFAAGRPVAASAGRPVAA